MSDENCSARANVSTAQLRKGKTIEQIYQKKTQLEHILLRPDTYVGSIEHQLQDMWVFDEVRGQLEYRKIDYVPALYKIFDEILVNAADNMKRDSKMDLIDVTIDRQQGCISVMNNGLGPPVQIHQEHKCYVPELIFGHLLTSDNYDDNEKKVTGGRNGFGAKLTNAFSKRFVIETVDKSARKKFTQVFEENMSKKHPPKVVDCSGAEYTRVTFWPDFGRFGMTGLDSDITALMMKRVYDVAGSTDRKCKVVLNGNRLPIKIFKDYVDMYLNLPQQATTEQLPCVHEIFSDRWEVAFSLSDGTFQQVSFVNSINTIKGGTHVSHVCDQLVEAILKVVKGKNRGGIDIKPSHVKNHLRVFINCLIENPAFDSQTKETLTTKAGKFGSSCEVSDKFIKQVMKSGVVELILDWVRAKQKVDLSRQMRANTKNTTRVLGIPKLEDANDAGGRNSQDCTLILTEGDSAKSLAVAGLSVVGRDKYGVFPLKGKVLNVRDANYKQVAGNAEIQNLLKILGLDIKASYADTSKLRYGSIMLMTDQDHDGSHIKGLLINLIHFWWPSLVSMNGFLKEFITPIVKVWKAGSKDSERREETSFFTMTEYEDWRHKTNNGKGWKSKYYKGLGTSTMKEAKEYFRDIEQHEIRFKWANQGDGEAIDLAFNRKRADDRKDWINAYEDGTFVDHSRASVGYTDFIHKELVQFAKYDVQRSVPSVVDGFKPSQRKVLFCSFKKKLKNDIKVAQFVGYISEQSAYHHGESSLEHTIVNLAQNFVGSNNLNLLVPSGQFGTRLQGGKDHAASRYIYTRLQPATRAVFHPDDDPVLEYLDEEGLSIEPKWYCPVIPNVLVNGADGIGVGWSTFIPNYNPRDLIRNIRGLLRGQPMFDIHPWYKGFRGTITPNDQGKYDVVGTVERKSDTTLEITELPVKTWTQGYKEWLEEQMPADGKKADEESKHLIEEFREYHTESTVHFVCSLTQARMRQAVQAGLEKTFKVRSSIAISNMVLFDAEGKITKYATALDILRDFCRLRLDLYDKRKAYLVAKLTREKEILSNKARFILMVVEGELELRRKKKADLLKELQRLGFTPMSKLNAIMDGKGGKGHPGEAAAAARELSDDHKGEEAIPGDDSKVEKTEYDYLLGMNLWSLTFEKVEEIKKLLNAKKQELEELQRTSLEQIWDRDLAALSAALDEMDAQEAEEAAAAETAVVGRKRKRGARTQQPPQPAPRPVPGRSAAEVRAEEALLARPLVSTERVMQTLGSAEKTVWGVGEKPEQSEGGAGGGGGRSVAAAVQGASDLVDLDISAAPAPARPTPAPAATGGRGKGKGRGRGRPPRAAAQPEPAEAGGGSAEATEDSSGALLLSRLLSRPGTPSPVEPGPAHHQELNTSSSDFFSNDFFSSLGLSVPAAASAPAVDLDIEDDAPLQPVGSSKAGTSRAGRGAQGTRNRSQEPPARPNVLQEVGNLSSSRSGSGRPLLGGGSGAPDPALAAAQPGGSLLARSKSQDRADHQQHERARSRSREPTGLAPRPPAATGLATAWAGGGGSWASAWGRAATAGDNLQQPCSAASSRAPQVADTQHKRPRRRRAVDDDDEDFVS